MGSVAGKISDTVCPGNGEPVFRIVSWNLLSPRKDDWETRKAAIHQRLEELDADVVALQEALPRSLEDSLHDDMRYLGYAAYHRDDPDVDGIEPPVLYVKTSTFRVVSHDCHQRTIGAVLYPRAFQGAPFGLLTVHLAGAPGEGKTRIGQTRKALKRLSALLEPDGPEDSMRVIICGDFNETPSEGRLHSLLTTGSAPSGDKPPGDAKEWSRLQLTDVYSAMGEDSTHTWPVPGPCKRRIDWMLCSSDFECTELPAPSAPDDDYPSDHLLIAADLQLNDE